MIILVVGMHRSGTSLVARGLHAMGLNLGDDVDTTPHPANLHGHWEHAAVWQAQEELLIRFGREWHSSPGPLPDRWCEWPDTRATIERFTAIAAAELTRHGRWVVKDPRSSLLIPLWREVTRRIGCDLRLIRLLRHPDEVAASLAARNGMPRELALRIWHDHHHSLDRDTSGLSMLTVHHDALLRDPLGAFTAMGDTCGLPDAPARAAVAAALVEPTLWHHRASSSPTEATATGASVPPRREPADLGRVLIVMRTRWRLHMLPRAIRSVLAQTYPDWFLQIVNDGGPPHLVESEVAPYRHLLEGRLGILHRERQHGMEAASNAGIAAAPGDVIAIHDDDDSWNPEFLERLLAWMQERGYDAAISRSRLVREAWNGRAYERRHVVEFGPELDRIDASDLAAANAFPPIAFLFRRSVFDEVGPFHEGLPALGDWQFNRRVAATRSIGVLPETLASWHLREPDDRFPNSSATDHRRMDEVVQRWPDPVALPTFFSEARQVRVWDESCLAPLPRLAATHTLPPGLFLVRFPLEPDGAPQPRIVRFATSATSATGHLVSLTALPGEPVAVLLNATEPVLGITIGRQGREPQPIDVEAVQLGNPLASLETFAGPPRLPDVLCIGAQRAGTTWLYESLRHHPRVWDCGIKEFHHFDWDGREPDMGGFRQRQALAIVRSTPAGPDRDRAVRTALRHGFPAAHSWGNYAATFEAAPRTMLACDVTPAYATLDEREVAEIVRMMPEVKVIFVLRDPVTRAVSGGLHRLRHAGVAEPAEAELLEACHADATVLRTDYLRTLDCWHRHLPAGQLLVLFHDDIASDPAGVVERACRFLGLATPTTAGSTPAMPTGPRNTTATMVPAPMLARVKADLSRRWLPMLQELERRYGEPVGTWRRAADARLRAAAEAAGGAGAGLANTVGNNLAQWDHRDPWSQQGDQWDGQARHCGIDYGVWKAGIMARYLPLLPRGGTILEIGPGHGRWSDLLIDHAGLLVLCDISPNCLDACRQRLMGRGRLRTHLAEGADLPSDLSGSVDAVWSYDCLVHVAPEQTARYVSEVARVLRPGGVAILHHGNNRRPAMFAWASRLAQGRRADAVHDRGWRSAVSRRDIRRWAKAAGLTVERQESTWAWKSPQGTVRVGVPRFGDCITLLRHP